MKESYNIKKYEFESKYFLWPTYLFFSAYYLEILHKTEPLFTFELNAYFIRYLPPTHTTPLPTT